MKDALIGAGSMFLVIFVGLLIAPWAIKFMNFYFTWVMS